MTGTVSYVADCSSYQGVPGWAKAAAVLAGGAEKVTEGTGYVNPDWPASKAELARLAGPGFVPLAYLFLDASGSGAAQAQWFARNAGGLSGFGIVVDFERAPDGNPTLAQAGECTAELRRLYPRHPVGGYCPHWYTAGEDLSFCDWLWASSYVTGTGDPDMLYRQVPASWWAPYGGRSPLMLQFTQSASVTGISGPADCSAFNGTPGQLAARVLPVPPAPKLPPAASAARLISSGDGSMLIPLHPGEVPVTFPVWASASAWHEPAGYGRCSLVASGRTGAIVTVTAYPLAGAAEHLVIPLKTGNAHPVVLKRPWSAYSVIEVSRVDTRASLPASATFRTW